MARTRSIWTTRSGRAVLTLVVVGLASASVSACGGASSASSRAAAISAAVASAAAAETSAAAARTSTAGTSPSQATAEAAGGSAGQSARFTDAQVCTWLKQELVAVKNIGDSVSVQFNILGSLSNFFDKHGGLSNASGSAVEAATERACPADHDKLLRKAKLKSFGVL